MLVHFNQWKSDPKLATGYFLFHCKLAFWWITYLAKMLVANILTAGSVEG